MRPIKFRAFIVFSGMNFMAQVESIHFGGPGYDRVKMNDYSVMLENVPKELKNTVPYHLRSSEVKLMQFTGLHDKNGKEIWEGDIVKEVQDEDSDRKPFIIEIKIPNIFFERWASTCGEVLGNIYENPELLK